MTSPRKTLSSAAARLYATEHVTHRAPHDTFTLTSFTLANAKVTLCRTK